MLHAQIFFLEKGNFNQKEFQSMWDGTEVGGGRINYLFIFWSLKLINYEILEQNAAYKLLFQKSQLHTCAAHKTSDESGSHQG